MSSKRYNNIKLGIGIFKSVTSFLLILAFVYFHFSLRFEYFLQKYIANSYVVFIVFVLLVGFASIILYSPLNYIKGFYLEHKYNLSNQTFG
ncbi:MAG TPA: hypothetical protein VLB50_08390, partial [Ignavibacteriaceae bacterium]|nr:hypothetical protein [Ignavibacteriaceae bacterium]